MNPEAPAYAPLREDLKLAGVLAVAAALATAALFPYLMVVMPQVMAMLPPTIPLWVIVGAQMAQAGVLLGLLSLLGLRLGHRVGLGAPWLHALVTGRERPALAWPLAICLGVLAGLAILGLDPLFSAHMPAALDVVPPPSAKASAGVGFLASFYGGIAEELQLRLFLMTLVVWLLSLLKRGRSAPWMFWLALLVAAAAFGAGHLPAAAKVWPLDGIVITRTLLLNGIGGVVFGWLYWKRGLEAAMIAHFSADLVLHVLAPLAFG